jgi:hypothetical protein
MPERNRPGESDGRGAQPAPPAPPTATEPPAPWVRDRPDRRRVPGGSGDRREEDPADPHPSAE